MKHAGNGTARRISVALGISVAMGAGAGQPALASHPTVVAVKGSAFGYWADDITLFGGMQPDVGPTPTATLAANASNSPQTGAAPSGSVAFGPATFFSSGPISATTAGTVGVTGSVTTTATVQNVNTSQQESLTATTISSTCTADLTGATGSTTVTGGVLEIDNGLDLNNDDDYIDAGEHAPVVVDVPGSPGPNLTYDGHLHVNGVVDTFQYIFNEQTVDPDGTITVTAVHQRLLGPSATGDLFIGRSVCDVTSAPASHPGAVADVSVTVTGPDTVGTGESATYTVQVTNNGPETASGVALLTGVSGGRLASVTGGTCTVLKGKVKGTSCDVGSLGAGATSTFTVVATAPRKAGAMTVTASVSSTSTDENALNDSASKTTTVQRLP